jgi:DeoR/GlpR family transcriptional regulator of sugar metabolism
MATHFRYRRLQIGNDQSEITIQILVLRAPVGHIGAPSHFEIRMSRPLAVRRQNEILRRLRSTGSVSVAELAQSFGVSHETIRRDLKALAEFGQLEHVHGGAVLRSANGSAHLPAVVENIEGVTAIARAAAALVGEGASILLDSCPATIAVAHELAGRTGLTVCTNSLGLASLLSRVPGNRVFMLGGEIDGENGATFGTDAVAAVGHFRVDIAFVGVAGFAEDGGATDASRELADLRGRMILTGRAFIVADHGKFARRTPFRIPHFDRAAGVIVDRAPDDALANAWTQSGIQVIAAH